MRKVVSRLYKKVKNKIIKQSKPYLVEINTFRYLEHCGPNDDDKLNYRNKREISKWHKKDQIIFLENQLFRKKILTKTKRNRIYKKIMKEISNAFLYAEKSKYPNKKDLMNFIYE